MKYWLVSILFLLISCSKQVEPSKRIAIQLYGDFSIAKADTIAKTISVFYKMKTTILPPIQLPKTAFVDIKSPRYRADSIIRIQNRTLARPFDFVIGLTNKDISVTKKGTDGNILKPEWKYNDFGIMGLGYCPGNSCIVSTYRLKSSNKELELARLKKVAIHELGHNLGLPHCKNTHCVMTSAAEKSSTIDNEYLELCKKCNAIIF